MNARNTIRLFALGALIASACGESAEPTEPSGDCAGGKCDEIDGKVTVDCLEDHAGLGTDSFELGDALAKLVYADGQCEQGFEDTVAALKDSGKCSNHRSMLVSEIAQRIGAEPPFYRSVTAMDCELGESDDGDTLIGGVWFSLFTGPNQGPGSFNAAEAIAFDPVNGIFNYYDTSSNEIQFFGDSMQFIQDERSAAQAAGSNDRKCGGCHRGGGLIMKELPSPWMHWTPDFDSPGHDELIERNPDAMGDVSDGVDLETGIVRPNNRNWNRSRISKVVAGLGTTTNTQLLLRPLFCTEDINLDSNFGSSVSSGPVGGGVVTDERLSSFASISINSGDYEAAKKEFNQKMANEAGGADDTVGALARVFRASSDIDYQDKLRNVTITKPDRTTEQIEIVDSEFIDDVLMVDFTRAIQFDGDDRCELLKFAPDLRAEELSPQAIREGFIENLEDNASSQAAQDFLSYLKDDEDDANATVQKFENACNNRDDKKEIDGETFSGVAIDYLSFIFHNRNRAAAQPMFEFDGLTMPITDDFPSGTRLSPTTCELVTSYVSPEIVKKDDPDPGRGGGAGGDPDSCADRCGEVGEDDACFCDAECLENDDCCDDFDMLCGDVTADLSCEDRCGQFDPDQSCQCNFECDEAGDCCNDWGAECMDPGNIDPGPAPDPKLSCNVEEGGDRCGSFNPGANCQCNAGCVEIGDCCPDFSLVCDEAQPEPEPNENCIHVAEVFYDAVGGDDGKEWVKLYNSCSGDQSIDGMSLGYGGSNYTTGGLDLEGEIGGGKCIIIGGPASDEDNGTPGVDIAVNFRPDLQNSGAEADGVALFNVQVDDVFPGLKPIDAVIYGGENRNDLLDPSGAAGDPNVGDAPEGSSVLRTGRDSWEISEPDPTSCPDF